MSGKSQFALAVILTTTAWAQSVISAHSGVIHYKEGQVEVDGKPVKQDPQKGQFGEIKAGQKLIVKDGQAEILLTPGVFLRVAEDSSFRMISNKLADTRIEVLSGSVIGEVGELLQNNAITLIFNGVDVSLLKRGLYRIDFDPAQLRVYDGEARVSAVSQEAVTAKKGRAILFSEHFEAKAFDTKQTDAFYKWCARRDEYVAEANVSAAKSVRDSGIGYVAGNGSGSGYGNGSGNWAYNPWFGMFTYMPSSGVFYSPFGSGFYSPSAVGDLYVPGSPYYYGGGTSVVVARNGMGSGLPQRGAGASSTITRSGGIAGSPVGGAAMHGGISGAGGAGHAGGGGGHR
jgi:hypothetical protein